MSGTPVTSMLDVSVVKRVAGDDDAGFWRRGEIPDDDIRQHYPFGASDEADSGLDVELEGYRWGGLTSGAAKAAVWMLFAPFALMNAAAAAHMPGTTQPETRRGIAPGVEGALLRLLALTLSFTLVFAVYISAVDVVGWQCGMPRHPRRGAPFTSSCTGHASITHFLFWNFANTPARHVVITTLIPIVVVLLIWKLASATWQRYESFPSGASLSQFEREEGDRTPFDDPAFWDGRERTEMLRHLHVAACFAGLAAMVATVWICAHQTKTATAIPRGFLAVALLALAIVVVFTAVGVSTRRRQATYFVLAGSGALLVATLIWTWWATLGTPPHPKGPHPFPVHLPAALPGVGRTVTVLFTVQLALILAIFVAGVIAKKRSSQWKSQRTLGLRGYTSAALCMLSLVVAGLFAAGLILRVADTMGKARPRAEIGAHAARAIVTPAALVWIARGTVLAAAIAVVRVLWIGLPVAWSIWRARGEEVRVEASSLLVPAMPDSAEAEHERRQRGRAVQRARDIGALPDRAGKILGPAIAACFVAGAFAAVFAIYGDFTSNRGWAVIQSNTGFDWRIWTASAGSWLIVGLAGAMLTTMVRAYRSPDERRTVGIIWDLATFWPRAAHPWSPPCYAERTVPQYAARAMYLRYGHAPKQTDKVVLSAHSQGTIIAAAALLQLQDATGIGLLSYGCPLDRLYAKYFPAYFGDPTLPILYDRLHGAWRNLNRETDPIGGAVTIPAHAEVDVDVPIPTTKNPGDDDYPPIEAHSRYPREALYADKLIEVRGLL